MIQDSDEKLLSKTRMEQLAFQEANRWLMDLDNCLMFDGNHKPNLAQTARFNIFGGQIYTNEGNFGTYLHEGRVYVHLYANIKIKRNIPPFIHFEDTPYTVCFQGKEVTSLKGCPKRIAGHLYVNNTNVHDISELKGVEAGEVDIVIDNHHIQMI